MNPAPPLPLYRAIIKQGSAAIMCFLDTAGLDTAKRCVNGGQPFRVTMRTPGGFSCAVYLPALGGIVFAVDCAVASSGQVYIPVYQGPDGALLDGDSAAQVQAQGGAINTLSPAAPECASLRATVAVLPWGEGGGIGSAMDLAAGGNPGEIPPADRAEPG